MFMVLNQFCFSLAGCIATPEILLTVDCEVEIADALLASFVNVSLLKI